MTSRADHMANARQREERTERGQHLRQHGCPADAVDQAPPFTQRGRDRRAQDRKAHDEGANGAKAERDQRDLGRIEDMHAVQHDILQEQRAEHGDSGDDEGRQEEPVAEALRTGVRSAALVLRDDARPQPAGAGE